MLKAGGFFTENTTMSAASLDLGTNNLKFTNPSNVGRIWTPTILKALSNGYNTWIITGKFPPLIYREVQV